MSPLLDSQGRMVLPGERQDAMTEPKPLVLTIEVTVSRTDGNYDNYHLADWIFYGAATAGDLPAETFEMMAEEAASALRQLPLSGRLV